MSSPHRCVPNDLDGCAAPASTRASASAPAPCDRSDVDDDVEVGDDVGVRSSYGSSVGVGEWAGHLVEHRPPPSPRAGRACPAAPAGTARRRGTASRRPTHRRGASSASVGVISRADIDSSRDRSWSSRQVVLVRDPGLRVDRERAARRRSRTGCRRGRRRSTNPSRSRAGCARGRPSRSAASCSRSRDAGSVTVAKMLDR